MPSFQRTESIEILATNKVGGSLADATAAVATVTDPDGTVVVSAQTMTKTSTGTYHYYYAPGAAAVLGAYHVQVKMTNSARDTIEESAFFVN